MKLITVELARVLQLFDADEIKPTKGLYLPDLMRAVTDRYKFINPPDEKKGFEGGMKFRGGQFVTQDRTINVTDLTIYNDGIATEAANSEESDFVLNEFIVWIREHLGINEPITKIPRSYISGVVVDFDFPINKVLTVFETMSAGISAAIKKTYDAEVSMSIHRLALSTDKKVRAIVNTDFTIERRIGSADDANRFFSGAPLPTTDHVELLKAFERAAKS